MTLFDVKISHRSEIGPELIINQTTKTKQNV